MTKIVLAAIVPIALINPYQHNEQRLACFHDSNKHGLTYGITAFDEGRDRQVNVGICGKDTDCGFSSVFDAKIVNRVGWLGKDTVGVELKGKSPAYASIKFVNVNNLETNLLTKYHSGTVKLQRAKIFSFEDCSVRKPAVVGAK